MKKYVSSKMLYYPLQSPYTFNLFGLPPFYYNCNIVGAQEVCAPCTAPLFGLLILG